jgi:fatty acid desaturase
MGIMYMFAPQSRPARRQSRSLVIFAGLLVAAVLVYIATVIGGIWAVLLLIESLGVAVKVVLNVISHRREDRKDQ